MTRTATIKISGMSCGGCVSTVRSALKEVQGVASADVSLENKEAVVTFDDGVTDLDQLQNAVAHAGYTVEA